MYPCWKPCKPWSGWRLQVYMFFINELDRAELSANIRTVDINRFLKDGHTIQKICQKNFLRENYGWSSEQTCHQRRQCAINDLKIFLKKERKKERQKAKEQAKKQAKKQARKILLSGKDFAKVTVIIEYYNGKKITAVVEAEREVQEHKKFINFNINYQ